MGTPGSAVTVKVREGQQGLAVHPGGPQGGGVPWGCGVQQHRAPDASRDLACAINSKPDVLGLLVVTDRYFIGGFVIICED